MSMVLAAVCASAASADAQVLGAPTLPQGTTRELSLSTMQPEFRSYTTSDAGVMASYRRTGRMNLSARLGVVGNVADAELGTFGALPLPRVGGIDLGWTAGLGFNGIGDGLYVPVGVNVSRPFQVRGTRVTPFAHGRVQLVQIDPPERELGEFTTAMEAGVDVGVGSRWSVRAGLGSLRGESQQLLLGIAYSR
jgi:hypothetical protein